MREVLRSSHRGPAVPGDPLHLAAVLVARGGATRDPRAGHGCPGADLTLQAVPPSLGCAGGLRVLGSAGLVLALGGLAGYFNVLAGLGVAGVGLLALVLGGRVAFWRRQR